MRKRFTRVEQTERNRERVLAVARRVFLAKGYHAACIDEMAEEAGFSKGVVYSQFGSKADLFFALLERRIEERAARNLEAIAGKPPVDALRALWQLGEEARRAEGAWPLLVLEFRIHAARDPELRQRYSEMHRHTLEGIAALIESVAFQDGRPLPFTSHDLARLVLALDSGYALEESVDPRGWSTAPGGAALSGLIEGLAQSPPQQSRAGRSRR
jgi:AcrR family transcriptional regulator